ncbi:hypothetical protein BK022_15675 [Methylorubrum extorquens]|uniref:Uncharacterized protein n=1 Tax=Methylorubrum extorquens TaxID=408 RepID=A0A1S1P3Z0_METEX|nr:hypothetical protein BK022_15675 [Methylorubrum extorquens]
MIAQAVGGKLIEIWFADEARGGQKNMITRRWAERGTRPAAPKDQRTASAYIFGAICPDLPLILHPAAIRALSVSATPLGAG